MDPITIGFLVLLFEEADVNICRECLDNAMKGATNLKGHVVERVVEKVVEKPVYIKDGGIPSSSVPESMEELERRIMGG